MKKRMSGNDAESDEPERQLAHYYEWRRAAANVIELSKKLTHQSDDRIN